MREMDQLSDRELRGALAGPGLDRRDRAYARELLRRRYDARPNAAWRQAWLSVLYGWGLTRAAISQTLNGKP
jgi:hypothetical protein